MLYLTLIWGLIKRFWLPALVLVLAASLCWYVYDAGIEHEKDKQAVIDAKAKVKLANDNAAEAIALAKQLVQAHDAYVVATEKVHAIDLAEAQETQNIIVINQETRHAVTTRIPASTPPLPGAWRVLHDAAALGVRPPEATASAPRGADGAPVSAQDAATTVIENYGTYHQLASRMLALQRYVTEVCK